MTWTQDQIWPTKMGSLPRTPWELPQNWRNISSKDASLVAYAANSQRSQTTSSQMMSDIGFEIYCILLSRSCAGGFLTGRVPLRRSVKHHLEQNVQLWCMMIPWKTIMLNPKQNILVIIVQYFMIFLWCLTLPAKNHPMSSRCSNGRWIAPALEVSQPPCCTAAASRNSLSWWWLETMEWIMMVNHGS